MIPRAFVFPGQGSQTVGMGKALAEQSAAARAVFEQVDDALGEKLSDLMFAGDEATLTLTENAQPALMAVSLAVIHTLRERSGRELPALCSHVAGHSLGEYSALAAAGALEVGATARLLRLRGRSMQQAVPVGAGAMAAILGLDEPVVAEVAAEAAEGETCAIANDNAPGQVVISGHTAAIDRAIAAAKARGAKRAVPLSVSAPFHCGLMAPAADAMAEALANTAVAVPSVPVVANVTAAPTRDPAAIRQLLVEQVTGRVRWRECCLTLRDAGVTDLVEAGAGKVLTGLAKRIDKSLSGRALQTVEEIDAFLQTLDA